MSFVTSFNPNSLLENSTCFPLCKRGIEGDLAVPELVATVKSPLAPLLQRGECLNLPLMDYLGACRTYGDRSEDSSGRGQILPVLQVNSHSIDQKNGEIWTAQTDMQPIHHKSDRLLGSTDFTPSQIGPFTC
jgi:hypothetical protein